MFIDTLARFLHGMGGGRCITIHSNVYLYIIKILIFIQDFEKIFKIFFSFFEKKSLRSRGTCDIIFKCEGATEPAAEPKRKEKEENGKRQDFTGNSKVVS